MYAIVMVGLGILLLVLSFLLKSNPLDALDNADMTEYAEDDSQMSLLQNEICHQQQKTC